MLLLIYDYFRDSYLENPFAQLEQAYGLEPLFVGLKKQQVQNVPFAPQQPLPHVNLPIETVSDDRLERLVAIMGEKFQLDGDEKLLDSNASVIDRLEYCVEQVRRSFLKVNNI